MLLSPKKARPVRDVKILSDDGVAIKNVCDVAQICVHYSELDVNALGKSACR